MEKRIPQHIVLFPDGNRRWAKEKGLPTLEGHKQGYKKLVELVSICKNRGVKILTAFGFSTENWNRSEEEVTYLMQLLETGISELSETFKKDNVRVRVIGQRDRLPKSLQEAIEKAEAKTKDNNQFYLNLAVSYGGKWDIMNAAKNIIKEGISLENITEETFENHLSTAGLPTPDLIIRPGGQMRLSNFVLWQAAYAELYFSPKMWPDFTEQDVDAALEEFDSRQRRFGK